MTDGDDEVRYTVKMPKRLRRDAKKNSEHGELAEAVRGVFRERAYGIGRSEQPSELGKKQAELREVRERIDQLRHKRKQIEAEIETKESRQNRLEEDIRQLEQQQSQVEQSVEMLTNMVENGECLWPTRIKNAADVDEQTAVQIHERLIDENPELPPRAFEEPNIHEPNDWREQE